MLFSEPVPFPLVFVLLASGEREGTEQVSHSDGREMLRDCYNQYGKEGMDEELARKRKRLMTKYKKGDLKTNQAAFFFTHFQITFF